MSSLYLILFALLKLSFQLEDLKTSCGRFAFSHDSEHFQSCLLKVQQISTSRTAGVFDFSRESELYRETSGGFLSDWELPYSFQLQCFSRNHLQALQRSLRRHPELRASVAAERETPTIEDLQTLFDFALCYTHLLDTEDAREAPPAHLLVCFKMLQIYFLISGVAEGGPIT